MLQCEKARAVGAPRDITIKPARGFLEEVMSERRLDRREGLGGVECPKSGKQLVSTYRSFMEQKVY